MSTTPGSPAPNNAIEEARSHLNALTRTLEKEISDVSAARSKLEKDITEYEALKAQVSSVHNLPSVVSLNVGGTIYATAKENLLKEKGSLLEIMFTTMSVAPSPDGSYFIDRDQTAVRLSVRHDK